MDSYNQDNYNSDNSNSESFETTESFETAESSETAETFENIEQIEENGAEGEKKTNVLALLAMIFGIVGLALAVVCCFKLSIITIPLLVAALVMGIIANKKEKTGMGTAGFVLGLVGIILSLIFVIANIVLVALGLGANLIFGGMFVPFAYIFGSSAAEY